ncbi:hypothetical protein EG68_03809 [Paragonimus skrjabini miyazakii]|uniref:Uncharacterized protein n=1 Tax=Paragonimus skrjabini miyazakii TaxID=59628 RepID=A0A8S9YX46_9TREM|nr:hypothetical protein EG68_03809 [Paragonimus skrjabini miyazakii]
MEEEDDKAILIGHDIANMGKPDAYGDKHGFHSAI